MWNRTRSWRGRVARDQPVSASVAHSTVLTVRNFLDDITLWGWAGRPADASARVRNRRASTPPTVAAGAHPRRRCRADRRRQPSRGPVRPLGDHASATGRAATRRIPRPRTRLRRRLRAHRNWPSRSANSPPNAPSPSTPTPSPRSMTGPLNEEPNAPTPIPAPASQPTSSSPNTAAGSSRGASAPGYETPSTRPGSPAPAARRCGSRPTCSATPTPPNSNWRFAFQARHSACD